jgi:hypothetical protein
MKEGGDEHSVTKSAGTSSTTPQRAFTDSGNGHFPRQRLSLYTPPEDQIDLPVAFCYDAHLFCSPGTERPSTTLALTGSRNQLSIRHHCRLFHRLFSSARNDLRNAYNASKSPSSTCFVSLYSHLVSLEYPIQLLLPQDNFLRAGLERQPTIILPVRLQRFPLILTLLISVRSNQLHLLFIINNASTVSHVLHLLHESRQFLRSTQENLGESRA